MTQPSKPLAGSRQFKQVSWSYHSRRPYMGQTHPGRRGKDQYGSGFSKTELQRHLYHYGKTCSVVCLNCLEVVCSEAHPAFRNGRRRAARYESNNSDSTPGCVYRMLHTLQWDSLPSSRQCNRLCMLYRCIHSHRYQAARYVSQVDINKDYYLQNSDRRTRSSQKFFQERISHDIYWDSFFPRTIIDCNPC